MHETQYDDIPLSPVPKVELPPPTGDDVNAEAARRIAATGHDWMVLRSISTGVDVPKQVLDAASSIREAANRLTDLPNVPVDFADDKWWVKPLEDK